MNCCSKEQTQSNSEFRIWNSGSLQLFITIVKMYLEIIVGICNIFIIIIKIDTLNNIITIYGSC